MNHSANSLRLKYFVSAAFILIMTGISDLSANIEIIFPEIFALLCGCVIMPRLPWRISKPLLAVLMTASAVLGLCIQMYLPFAMPVKVIVGFAAAALLVTAARSTLYPVISACVLPIITEADSILYPVSVCVMSVAAVLIMLLLEKKNFREAEKPSDRAYDDENSIMKWIIILVWLIPAAIAAWFINIPFIIAPPLLVAFTELSYPKSKAASSSLNIYLLLVIAAVIGAVSRYTLTILLPLPLVAAAAVTMGVFMPIIKKTGKLFPPACAISILPLILSEKAVLLYPFAVAAGAGYFLLAAWINRSLLSE